MKKNKIGTILMLMVLVLQIFAPSVYNIQLFASEVRSQVDTTQDEQSATSENNIEENSEIRSELVSETDSDQAINSEVVTSDIIDETTSSEVANQTETTTDKQSSQQSDDKQLTKGILQVKMDPSDIYADDNITNEIELSFDPSDSGTDLKPDEVWETVTITLDPELDFNEEFGLEITQGTPKIITGYDVVTLDDGSIQLVLDIDAAAIAAGGQTISIVFLSNVVGGVDLGKYGINVETCGNMGTCFNQDTSITYHDPVDFEITKAMIDPKYAAAGEAVTYEITMNATGTGSIEALPQMIDHLPADVAYVSSSPEGIITDDTITWDWTTEDIEARTKTVTVTIIPDKDIYLPGEKITNTASAIYDGKETDTATSTEDIYPGFFIDLPDGGIDKNGDPSVNPDGNTTAPGDQIFWHFDNINYDGNATLNNYTLTDTFPKDSEGNDLLLLNKVCYGTVKEAPNAIVDITINYDDGSSQVLTASMDANGDNCIDIPDEANISISGVKDIVWNYGTVKLPFKITGAGVETTVSDSATADTVIENDLDADFNIPEGSGDGEWDICPPPYISYLNEDGSTECRDEDGEHVTLTDEEVYGIFIKDIESVRGNIDDLQYGDVITYKLTLGNAKGSPDNLLVDGIYDQLPDGLEYVEGSSIIDSSLPDSAVERFDGASNILSYSFLEDDTPLSIAPGDSYEITFKAKVTSKEIGELTNKAYLVSATPDLILNGTGTKNTTEPVDFDGDGELENVYVGDVSIKVNRAKVKVEKKITNPSKVFVPANVESDKSVIDYQFTITNQNSIIGQRYAPIVDPVLIDHLPKQIDLDESSFSFDYSNAAGMTGETVAVSNDGTSSPLDGTGQDVTFNFAGVLNPGDSITVTYSADVKDYAMASQIINEVELEVSDKDLYTEDSVFSDQAVGIIKEVAAQSISKQVDPINAEPGQSINYTVNVANTGTMPLSKITFIDDVPHAGIGDTTVNTLISVLPKVYYIPQGGSKVEEAVNFDVTYLDNDDNELMLTMSQDEFQEYIENPDYSIKAITKISAVLPVTLYPGDSAQLIFDVVTPTNGEDAAVVGDVVENTAHFTSVPITMDGKEGPQLSNDSNTVHTDIIDDPNLFAIGDFVYYDKDNNKSFDGDDEPAVNALVELYDADGNLIATTHTDSSGYYQFSGLEPGTYTVKKVKGYFDRWFKVYPEKSDVESLTQEVTLANSDNLAIDFRIIPASILGSIYHDNYDNDTTDDSYYDRSFDKTNEKVLVNDDSGVGESKIELYDGSGKLLKTITTVNGEYAFFNLKSGNYRVKSVPIITSDSGQEYLLTNEAEYYSFYLDRGDTKLDIDFGYIEPVDLAGTVWYDKNVNDIYDSGENTDSVYDQNRNLKVELLDNDGKVIDNTTTDSSDGTYNFERLLPANYGIKVTYKTASPNPIHGYDNIENSYFTESSDNLSSTITDEIKASNPGMSYDDNNLGLYQNAYISGKVYQDRNYNGKFDDTDKAATNVTIELLSADGSTVIDTQVIDSNGKFKFTEVDPAFKYQIRMSDTNDIDMFIDYTTPKTGNTDTSIEVGSDKSQAMYISGAENVFSLTPNQSLMNVDGSVYQYAKISSLAFVDMDGDGQQNFAGLDEYKDGIEITLTGTDGMGYEFEQTLTSITDGRVSFEDLNPGKSYDVVFTIPDGYNVTWKDVGDNKTDSDIDRNAFNKFVDLYAEDNKTVDGGMYQPVDLSGYVFTDTDHDGYLTSSDIPAANKTVTIKYNSATKPSTTDVKTDSNGFFELTGVEPGNYSTTVKLPDSSYEFTVKGTNSDSVIASDVSSNSTTPSQLILSGGSNKQDFDTGYNQRTSISGKIYLDTNKDLSWQSTELLIDGITVKLLDEDGKQVATTTTNSNGYYQFTKIEPGNYTVVVDGVNYAHYQNEDEIPSIQSDGQTPEFTAYSNTPVVNVDGSLSILDDTTHYLISDYVWEDTNYNGIQDASEKPVSGAKVSLLDSSGNELTYKDSYPDLGIASGDKVATTTDATGRYLLIVEGTGDYQVKIEADSKFYLTNPKVGSNDKVDSDFIADDEQTYIGYLDYTVTHDTRDIDGGVSDKGNISGYIYNDENDNHRYDLGIDKVLESSQVGLYTGDGKTLLESQQSDANGYYNFTDLPSGEYIVKFENLRPKNAYWLIEFDGSLYLDNNGYEAHRKINLRYGQDLENQNAGQNNQSILTGIVFDDTLANGIYENSSDKLLEGVTVSLKNTDGSQAVDNTGEVEITITDSSGQYLFKNVSPGDYYLEFTAPSGYKATNVVPADASSSSDNDATIDGTVVKSPIITVEEDRGYLTYSDAAFYAPVTISGYYYDDYNIDGKFNSSIDQPIEASEVKLYDNDNNIVDTVTTDNNGFYQFNDVVPNDYYVRFDTESYDFISKLGSGETKYDNDMKQDSTTEIITYKSGTKHTVENDGAVYNYGQVSGYIYEDMNNNGYYELSTESGLDVDVSLYNEDGFVKTIKTDSDGYYQFAELIPGNYYVEITDPGSEYSIAKTGDNKNGIANEINSDLTFDSQVIYSGQTDDIDFDGGFYQLTDISGQVFFDSDTNLKLNDTEFGIPNLTINLYNSDDLDTPLMTTATDSKGNYQFNDIIPGDYVVASSESLFGNYEDMPEDYQIKSDMKTPVFTAYSNTLRDDVDGAVTQGTDVYLIGDYVWEDVDFDGLQDEDEAPYSGMKVELLDSSGNSVMSTTSDDKGLYYFFAPKGDYTLSFTADDDYHFTKQALLNNDIDSNVPQTTENVSTTEISVTKNDRSYDAGVRLDANINGRVYYDKDASGTFNGTDASTEARTVSLYEGSRLVETKEINLANDGTYNFTDLEPGDYRLEFSDDVNRFWVQNSDGYLQFDNTAEGVSKRDLTVGYGETVNDQDAGYSTAASIAGFVYEDNDYDGTFSKYLPTPTTEDIALADVEVSLLDKNSNVLATTTTDSNGFYSFGNLEPYKSYGTEITNKDSDSDGHDDYTVSVLGDASTQYDNDMTFATTIGSKLHNLGDAEYNNLDYDAGLLEYTNISGYAYEDLFVNSTMDGDDLGLNNITATLYDETDEKVKSTTTNSDGFYQFTNIKPGYYYVKFNLNGYTTSPLGTPSTALDNDIDNEYQTSTINVRSRYDDDVNFDAAVYKPVSVGGTVFTDGNADGLYDDSSEAGLKAYNVELYNDRDQLLNTVKTDSTGEFEFTNLLPGSYYTKVEVRDNLITKLGTGSGVTNDLNQDGQTALQVVPSSETNYEDYDAGLYKLTAISGKIYLDTNADLTRQESEWLIPDLTVTLKDGDSNIVASTTTDSDGYYQFTDLTPGQYEVVAETTDIASSYENEDEVPSIQDTSSTGVFTAISDTPNTNVDGALTIGNDANHFIISDYVWEDTNYDGVQDEDEPVMAGVDVCLLDSDGNQLTYQSAYPGLGITAGDKICDTTDSNGNYLLIAETQTDFIVETSASEDYYITTTDSATEQSDNDFTGVVGSTNIGQLAYYPEHDTRDVDSGYSQVGTIGGNVYNDEDLNFMYDVGTDLDVSDSLVELYQADDLSKPIMTTVTDSKGYYQFKDLQAGDYVVKFEDLSKNKGFWTPEKDGNLILDNGGYQAHRNVTISYGEDKLHENAGKSLSLVFTGIAYEDMIADGIYDPSEDVLLPDVEAQLLLENGNIAPDGIGNDLVRTTDNNGRYTMNHIIPTNYMLKMISPTGYIPTGVVPKDANKSSANDTLVEGTDAKTDLFELEEGNLYEFYGDGSFYRPVTIEGDYFEDLDNDGKYDDGQDKLLSGYTVELVDTDGKVISTVETDSSGHYIFENVVPGNYRVRFDTSDFDAVSKLGVVDTKLENDINSDGQTSINRYTSGNTYSTQQDGAVYNYGQVSGYIYEDMNNNGYYELSTEFGLDVDVSLYNEDGFVKTIKTDSDGYYQYAELIPGNYYVEITDPGSEYSIAKTGDNKNGIANEINSDLTFDSQVIYSGQTDDIDFDGGFYQLTDISGQVFFDSDTNLKLNDTEFGIPNLTINLYNSDDLDTPLMTTVTDSKGNYQFNDIIPGDYVVASSGSLFGNYEDMPEDYQIKSDMKTPVFTAYSNTLRGDVDGAVTQGTDVYLIGDYVWEDVDFDGLQDEDEAPYSGMKVELLDSSGNSVMDYTTTSNGLYYFFVPKGDYTLSFTADDDYHFTKQALLNNDIDSNVPQTTENVSTTEISVTKNDRSYDAGVRLDANINGRVYYDKDASGTFNGTDESTEARTVSLYEGSRLVETKEINLANDGTYNFTDLEPGDYRLEFSDDVNRFWVQNSDGYLQFDNTAEGVSKRDLTVGYGETVNDQDAGYSTAASIAGFVYEDNDYDGTFSKYLPTPTTEDIALADVEVSLLDKNSNVVATTTTDSNGFYSFGNLEPYKSYGTEITNKDSDSDGHDDYTVSVLGDASTQYDNDMIDSGVIGSKLHNLDDSEYNNLDYDAGLLEYTNISGYVYEDLFVNSTMDGDDLGLNNITATLYDETGEKVKSTTTNSDGFYQFTNIKPGYYYVKFNLNGYTTSPLGTPSTALDNDIDNEYQTSTINVRSRYDDDVNFDAAVYKPVSVGGTVFTDGNADGLYDDSSEAGLKAYNVELYNDRDQLLNTVKTDSTGEFEFTNLLPGSYYTKVEVRDNLITKLGTGSGVTNDLNQDGQTALQVVPSSETNYEDYDAGLYKLTAISGKIYLDTNADLTRQESEWLIPDLTVTLKDGDSNIVASTTTDSDGYYQFTDLTPGQYEVVAETTDIASSYENEDEVPSIQDTSSTGVFTAISDTPNTNVDGALTIGNDANHFIISDYVWEDTNYDGVQDEDEPVMAGVDVCLLDSDGNQLTYQSAYPGLGITAGDKICDTTDSNGNYLLIAETQTDFIVETSASEDYYITTTDSATEQSDNDFTGVVGSTNIGQLAYYPEHDTRDVDSGYSQVGTIGGNVYNDEDLNFMYDVGTDLDVSDSLVELYQADDLSKPIMTTVTDSKGYYQFKDLQAGDYVVKFEDLSKNKGFWTPEKDGNLILDNGGYQAHRNVTISYGEDKLHENAGKSLSLVFTGIAYEDMIADGIYDPSEDVLLPDVEAQLLLENGNIAPDGIGNNLVRTTDNNGRYTMNHIIPTNYMLKMISPTGYIPTGVVPKDANKSSANDTLVEGTDAKTDLFELEEGNLYEFYGDGSFYRPVTIEGDYFEDLDNDGKYDDGQDKLLSGYTVELVDTDGKVISTVETDSSGHYIFENVVPGNYRVRFDTSDFDAVSKLGVVDTKLENDINSDGQTSINRYTSGNTYSTQQDGAVYNLAKISGNVFEDANNNGYYELSTESGLTAKVTLHMTDGTTQTTTTNRTGYYEFDELQPGAYYVTIEKPSDAYSPAVKGDNSLGLASDTDKMLATATQHLYSNQVNDVDFDAGMYRLSAISGQLFWDANQDLNIVGYDFGIRNDKVSLHRVIDGVVESAPIASAITDGDGKYRFDNVIPGEYVVRMDPTYFGNFEEMPAEYQVKTSGQTEIFTAFSARERTNVDGAVTRGIGINYIGDYVWEDLDGDGLQDPEENGYEGAQVSLLDQAGTVVDTTTTDSDGYYDFFALSGNYQIEVKVASDYHFAANDDSDTDLNSDTLLTTSNTSVTEVFDATHNRRDIDSGVRLDANINGRVYYDKDASGTFNNGDASTEPRTVSLYKVNGILRSDELVETVAIDTENDGAFSFTDLTEGEYRLEFSDDINRFWIENSDGQLLFDSSRQGLATRSVNVEYGQTVNEQDAGYAYGAAISGYIFNDDNYNGKFDVAEAPETLAKINLYDSNNNLIQTTVTDQTGHYGFTNLEPGIEYYTELENKDSDDDGVLDFIPSPKVLFGKFKANDMAESDQVIKTQIVALNDGEVNDVDFDGGIIYRTNLSGYAYEDKNTNSTYDQTDQKLSDINVRLYDNTGTVVDQTTTDSDGYYHFDDIEAGYYQVGFDLAEYSVSPKGQKDTKYDNDINNKYLTEIVNVLPKTGNDVSFDAAVFTPALDVTDPDSDEGKDSKPIKQMQLSTTGEQIMLAIIGLVGFVVVVLFIKHRYNK